MELITKDAITNGPIYSLISNAVLIQRVVIKTIRIENGGSLVNDETKIITRIIRNFNFFL